MSERDALPAGPVHFAGIGGVGMAGLALLLSRRGWTVTGCDAYEGPLLSWLRASGIPASVGHHPDHLAPDIAWIVRSPAVSMEDAELAEARRRHLPVFARGVVLPEVLKQYRAAAVAGTHGKTTTSSMLAWILVSAGRQPAYCIGGVCPNLGAVAHAGRDGFAVAEADESDGTLQFYRPEIGIITNMDLDHVDYFKTEAMQHQVYQQFAAQSGTVMYAAADETASRLLRDHPRRVTFGLESGADVAARDVVLTPASTSFDLMVRGAPAGRIELQIPGEHNVLNALAASAAAIEWGVDAASIRQALAVFQLPKRRFELVAQGAGIRVISDYAHHPAEIEALMKQARLARPARIIGVFQPHRYSRTLAFKKAFAKILSSLDYLVLAPVYAASEPVVPGGLSDDLFKEFPRDQHGRVELAESLEDAWSRLRERSQSGDLVLIIGAGDVENIGAWAAAEWGNHL